MVLHTVLVEPTGIDDASQLGIAGPTKSVPTDTASLLERRRKGSPAPIGDALAAMGPAGHPLGRPTPGRKLHLPRTPTP